MRAPPCIPSERPCLFNILWDPCEYHNLAGFMPKTTNYLFSHNKLIIDSGYIKYPLFLESDPNSDPKNYNNSWSSWKNSTKKEDEANKKDIVLLDKESNIVPKSQLNDIPFQLINEEEITDLIERENINIPDNQIINKIVKISCEEMDYFNLSIECINVESENQNNLKNITKLEPNTNNSKQDLNTNNLLKINKTGITNITTNQFQNNSYFENLKNSKNLTNIDTLKNNTQSNNLLFNVSKFKENIPINIERFNLESVCLNCLK